MTTKNGYSYCRRYDLHVKTGLNQTTKQKFYIQNSISNHSMQFIKLFKKKKKTWHGSFYILFIYVISMVKLYTTIIRCVLLYSSIWFRHTCTIDSSPLYIYFSSHWNRRAFRAVKNSNRLNISMAMRHMKTNETHFPMKFTINKQFPPSKC